MKIENMRLISGAGALVAKFDAVGDHLTIRGFGIFRKGTSSWISEPASRIEKRDGSVDYPKHVVITDPDVKADIERQAKAALLDLEHSGSASAEEDIPF